MCNSYVTNYQRVGHTAHLDQLEQSSSDYSCILIILSLPSTCNTSAVHEILLHEDIWGLCILSDLFPVNDYFHVYPQRGNGKSTDSFPMRTSATFDLQTVMQIWFEVRRISRINNTFWHPQISGKFQLTDNFQVTKDNTLPCPILPYIFGSTVTTWFQEVYKMLSFNLQHVYYIIHSYVYI